MPARRRRTTPSTTWVRTSWRLEKRFGFRPGDFRLWIALHEVTHRAQFRAVPWMKGYFLDPGRAALG